MYTVKEMLHAINVLDEDIDISVEDIGSIAVVAPICLSEKGMKRFEKVLEMQFDEESKIISDKYSARNAWDFLNALAGYCSESQFAEWFEINAKIRKLWYGEAFLFKSFLKPKKIVYNFTFFVTPYNINPYLCTRKSVHFGQKIRCKYLLIKKITNNKRRK